MYMSAAETFNSLFMNFSKMLLLAAAFPFALGAQADSTKKAEASTSTLTPPSSPEQGGVDQPAVGFSGTVFGRYTYFGGQIGQSQNSFNLDRAYVTYRANVSDRASVRVTTDISSPGSTLGGTGSTTSGYDVNVRYAYLQYDYLRGANWNATARFGLVHNAIIDHEQNFWPRWIAQTAIEQSGAFPISDFGAATLVSMPNKWGEVYAAVTNGTGDLSGDTDRFKDYQARVSFTPMGSAQGFLSSLSLTGWYYKGAVESNITGAGDALARDSWGLFVGVRDPRLTVGFDYVQHKEEEDSLSGAPPVRGVSDMTGRLISAYVTARPFQTLDAASTIPLGLVVRYDQGKPNTDDDATYSQFIAGLTWDLNKKVAFGLDYQEQYGNEASGIASRNTYNARWIVNF
jgi:hypothetical protein